MTSRPLTVLIACALLAAPAVALADEPDLDTGGFERGEREVEVNAWLRRGAWTVRPELEIGLADGVGLELQGEAARGRGGKTEWTNASAQLSVDLAEGGLVGAAVELGYDPSEKHAEIEAFVYASTRLGAWRADLNLGVEREGRETAAIYAWRISRSVGARWSLGLRGGGEEGLEKGGEAVRQWGPVTSYAIPGTVVAVTAGYVFETGGVRKGLIGLEWRF